MNSLQFLPRLIRLRDASSYLGMDRNRFNAEVRPKLKEIPIGIQGIAFDRLDLDAWVDDYKHGSSSPMTSNDRSLEVWDENGRQGSTNVTASGTLIKRSSGDVFAKALAVVTSKKRKDI
ncbi:MAG: hypothetical protein NTU49_00645 [Gammaproteobacteria bacterium]|nr:hypothetical protein [Gammaproteobacteria bacterium]